MVNLMLKMSLVNKRKSAAKKALKKASTSIVKTTLLFTKTVKPIPTKTIAISFANVQKENTWKHKLILSVWEQEVNFVSNFLVCSSNCPSQKMCSKEEHRSKMSV